MQFYPTPRAMAGVLAAYAGDPARVAYGDLTPEQQELHNRAMVKSMKLAPAAILRDTPAARRSEAFYQPLAEQYANCLHW